MLFNTCITIAQEQNSNTWFLLQESTGLHLTDSNFEFAVSDWDKDGRPDLFVINRKGIGTNSTQVHILRGASDFKHFILHTGTVLHQTDDNFSFSTGDWNNDAQIDLFVLKKQNTGSGFTEVHVINLLPVPIVPNQEISRERNTPLDILKN
ncbi:MAG: VCBS repeat-containing protein [Phaeodactylibacter sp.]|nr:VCBS repeat-containing protein [Phaeodactylibacter sp.]